MCVNFAYYFVFVLFLFPCTLPHPINFIFLFLLIFFNFRSILFAFCLPLPSYITAKGRTNIELREQFILADGVSQTMTAFRPKTSASSPISGSSLRTPTGPITKVYLQHNPKSSCLLLFIHFVLRNHIAIK